MADWKVMKLTDTDKWMVFDENDETPDSELFFESWEDAFGFAFDAATDDKPWEVVAARSIGHMVRTFRGDIKNGVATEMLQYALDLAMSVGDED